MLEGSAAQRRQKALVRAAPAPPRASLAKLSPEISERLRRTARLRRVDPLRYAEQILDRHLPKLHELERA